MRHAIASVENMHTEGLVRLLSSMSVNEAVVQLRQLWLVVLLTTTSPFFPLKGDPDMMTVLCCTGWMN